MSRPVESDAARAPTSAAPHRRPAPAPIRRLPPGFRLRLDRSVRRPRPETLIGGQPTRILRLKPAGGRLVDRWLGGQPIGSSPAEQAVAGRLVDAGLAQPVPPSDADLPSVTIVIPVKDDADGLAVTLRSLRRYAPGVPVLVVDDGSQREVHLTEAGASPAVVDAAASVLRHPRSSGPAAARNAGWRASPDRPIVLFVDAGCELEPGCLPAILAHFADPLVAAVAPRITSRGGGPLGRYERQRSPLDMGEAPSAVAPRAAVAYVPTAALAVRRQVLEVVDGFDEDLRFGEDVDLVWRLAEHGWRLRYEPGAVATHPVRPDATSWLLQRFHYGRSTTGLAARHGSAVAPFASTWANLAAWLLTASGHPAAGATVAAAGSARLARRIGARREELGDLAALTARGHLRTADSLAAALRRAWLPPAAALLCLAGGRRRPMLARWLLAAFVLPPLASWLRRRPDVDPLSWVTMAAADDLAYQAGVWAGAIEGRSGRALRPALSL